MRTFVTAVVLMFQSLWSPGVLAEVTIEPKGKFIDDCTLAGEQKSDFLHPSHPFIAQLSEDRFLAVYQTRGFSGVDAEHSIIYQLRTDAADGPVLKEGFLSQYREDWDFKGDGKRLYIKSHGHPKVLGVPKGAIGEDGKLFPAQNVFLATWYTIPALRDPETKEVKRTNAQFIEGVHFQLKDDGSDIEFISEVAPFRQNGFEKGRAVCSIEPPQTYVNQWLIPATAINADKTRFTDALHFPNGIAAIEIAFSADKNRFEWVRSGALVQEKVRGRLIEGSLHQLAPNDWLLAARARGHHWGKGAYGFCVAWYRTTDPFAGFGEPIYTKVPSSYCPKPVHLCPDGVLRVMSGQLQGGNTKRNPLFCWDVDPENEYEVSNQTVLLDMRGKIKFPMVGFAKLSPVKNNRQILTIRVTSMAQNQDTEQFPAMTREELVHCGAYYSVLTYDPPVPDTWQFSK